MESKVSSQLGGNGKGSMQGLIRTSLCEICTFSYNVMSVIIIHLVVLRRSSLRLS